VLDIARIVRMVGWKLISRGMCPIGLYRSLVGRTAGVPSEGHGAGEVAPARRTQPMPRGCGTRNRSQEYTRTLRQEWNAVTRMWGGPRLQV